MSGDREAAGRSSWGWGLAGPLLLVLSACGGGTEAAPQPPGERLVPIAGIRIRGEGAYQSQRVYTGTIAASRQSELGFERAGRLTEITVDEGDRVIEGQVIARLDARVVAADLASARATHAAAEALLIELQAGAREEVIAAAEADVEERVANVGELQVEWVRQRDLVAGEVSSQSEFDAVDFQLQAARARLASANELLRELRNGTRAEQIQAQQAVVEREAARIVRLEVDLDQTRLKAPYNGFITQRMADEGTVLAAGAVLFRLLEDAPAEARIGVPVDVAAALDRRLALHRSEAGAATGDHHKSSGVARCAERLRIGVAGKRTVGGTLRTVLAQVDPVTRTRTAVFVLDDAKSEGPVVIAGETVRWLRPLSVTLQGSGFWLPSSALMRSRRGLWACMVLRQDPIGDDPRGASSSVLQGVAERREVVRIHSESGSVLVQGTLAEGDIVLHGDLNKVAPGQRVQVSKLDGNPGRVSDGAVEESREGAGPKGAGLGGSGR